MRIALLLILLTTFAHGETVQKTDVFVAGEGGYHTYRIPAIVRTPQGTLLAFCEGRKAGQGDAGDIDLLLKRSDDNGRTWGQLQLIWDDGANTCGNPCPVVDEKTGRVLLISTHNRGPDSEVDLIRKRGQGTRTVWLLTSADNGDTWSAPRELTKSVKDPAWGWYATGPGVGIQVKDGTHAGRLVIPANHSYDDPAGKVRKGPYEYGAHVFFSDDHGETWQLGGSIRPKMNESQVVELFDGQGTLLMDMRSYFGRNRRAQATSRDGGVTWTKPVDAPALIEPVCQASIIRGSQGELLFSNPASVKRQNLTVRLSQDNARTWPRELVLHPGPSAYSCLISLPDKMAGCLYECGETQVYDRVTFARFATDAMPLRP